MLKYIFSLFFLLFSITFGNSGYYIKNYKIDIKIDDQNVYDINEKIDVNFTSSKRGIIRTLPLEYDDRKISVTDIRVNEPFKIEDEGNYLAIRIGDPNKYIRGNKIYKIDYNYHLGWDGINEYDEVYYNLIGNYWDTYINQVEFKIVLPKPFNAKDVNFTIGNRGSRSNSGVEWNVNGNTITGYTTRRLRPGEGLTIALPLPEGYFNTTMEQFKYQLANGIIYFLLIALPSFALYIWYRYGREQKPIETVEFYPPDEMTPMEAGYFIDGYLNNKDITSLIFYWADKGYLRIEEKAKIGFFKTQKYILIKLKEMKSTQQNEYEKYLFDALFSYAEDNQILELEKLENQYYKNIETGKEIFLIDMIEQNRQLYSAESERLSKLVKCSILLLIIAIVLRIFFLGFFGVYLLIPLAIIVIIFVLLMSGAIKKRTPYYNNVLGRLRGFKRFLITAEKQKLEMLLEENPEYFYNILPYAIVLGVTDKWSDKFKDLVTTPPTWYSSNIGTVFVMSSFVDTINRSTSSISNMITSAPTNTSRGDSSFSGGSSGGGAGGGGGSSW